MNMLNVILLENENIILFKSNKIYDYQIMNECIENTEFAKKHKPLIIIEKIPITDSLNIDDCVKNYMQYYGINHVRGGSYAKISKEQYEELRKEFCNVDAVKLFNDLKYFEHDGKSYPIDRNIIINIQWLMDSIHIKYNMNRYNQKYPHVILQPLAIFFSDHGVKEYSNLLVTMDAIIKKDINRKQECEYSDYLKNPYKLFDRLLFSNVEITSEDITIAKTICDYYEYLAYCIINKCDELEFEINHYNVPDNEILEE
jgi:hypothetical protein